MGVLTSKPVQVSPLSLGFVEILRSHQRLGRGHCWRCWPRTQTRQPYEKFVEPQPHKAAPSFQSSKRVRARPNQI